MTERLRDKFEAVAQHSHQYYRKQYKEGYRWDQNVFDEIELKMIEKECVIKKLEYFVGTIAFDADGEIVEEASCFMIKK